MSASSKEARRSRSSGESESQEVQDARSEPANSESPKFNQGHATRTRDAGKDQDVEEPKVRRCRTPSGVRTVSLLYLKLHVIV